MYWSWSFVGFTGAQASSADAATRIQCSSSKGLLKDFCTRFGDVQWIPADVAKVALRCTAPMCQVLAGPPTSSSGCLLTWRVPCYNFTECCSAVLKDDSMIDWLSQLQTRYSSYNNTSV